MAEDWDQSADDRNADHRDFSQTSSQRWKHAFRTGAIDGEQEAVQGGFESGFTACADIARELGRAQGVLAAHVHTGQGDNAWRLHASKAQATLNECIRQLLIWRGSALTNNTISEQNVEHNIYSKSALPTHDKDDIELWLGAAANDEQSSPVAGISAGSTGESSITASAMTAELDSILSSCRRCIEECQKLGREVQEHSL